MKKFLKQNINKIISTFLIISPIIDMVTGICIHTLKINFTFGIIIRMLFLMFIIFITTFIYKKKKSIIYYLVFFVYAILYISINIIFKGINIFSEIQGLLRVFYFPLLLISLYDLKDEVYVNKLTIFTTLYLYILAIFIPTIFNLGFDTYQITKAGTLGFFNSANEISGIISILTPFIFILFNNKKYNLFKIIFIIIYLFVILSVGTKTPLLSLIITSGMFFLYIIGSNIEKKKYKETIIITIIILTGSLGLITILPKTNFYKNIKVHLDYLGIENISDVLKDERLLDHFVFSERVTFLADKCNLYKESNNYQKLFGIGYINNNKETKLIEMDYYDIFYSHGLIGFAIFMLVPLYVLFKFAFQKRIYSYEMYMLNVSFLLIVMLSLLTGHIITSPSVSILVAIIILNLDCNKKKRLLFTGYNLEIGGIEKSLINLLKKINYDKYNVDLYLENKKGILIKDVDSQVNIYELKVSNNKNVFMRKIINLIRKINFTILNYNNYNFSCCYATYSLSGNVLSKIGSKNNSIYVHSNYEYVYETEKEVKKFFDDRKLYEFKTIFVVSNEASYIIKKIYKELIPKIKIYNNFIDIKEILEKSKDKIEIKRNNGNKLLVFVGRLDDKAKKVKRAINIVKYIDKIDLWIIGDGPDKKMYESYVSENKLDKRVKFMGQQINPYKYMKEADYIILTSDYEGFPVIYLESIVLNKDLITTIPVSDNDIIIGKNYGNIISKENDKMIKEIKNILTKKNKTVNLNINEIETNRMNKLEEIFDEVI